MVTEDRTQCIGNLSHCGAGAGGDNRSFENIALAAAGDLGKCCQGGGHVLAIAATARLLNAADLRGANGGIVDIENIDIFLVFETVTVDADDDLLALVHRCLAARCGLFDQPFRQAFRHRPGHAAKRLHLLDQCPGFLSQFIGQALDIIGTGQGIDDLGNACFMLEDKLGIAGNAGGKLCRQGNRLIEGIGV
ncbi:hypothetical protein D3C86_1674080 [compost metagenome]